MRPWPNPQQGRERMTEGQPAVMVTRGWGMERGAFWGSHASTEGVPAGGTISDRKENAS